MRGWGDGRIDCDGWWWDVASRARGWFDQVCGIVGIVVAGCLDAVVSMLEELTGLHWVAVVVSFAGCV